MPDSPLKDIDRYRPKKAPERRRKEDWINRTIKIIGVISWIVTIAILIIIGTAKPATQDFFANITNTRVSTKWNQDLVVTGFSLMAGMFVLCVIGFILNMKRHRRKTDRYNKSIIILGAVSLIGALYFSLSFGIFF